MAESNSLTVKINNISYDALPGTPGELELQSLLLPFGDPTVQLYKGYARATFDKQEDADNACASLNNVEFHGRPLRVHYPKPPVQLAPRPAPNQNRSLWSTNLKNIQIELDRLIRNTRFLDAKTKLQEAAQALHQVRQCTSKQGNNQ